MAKANVKFIRINHGGYDASYETSDGMYEIVKVYFGMSAGYRVKSGGMTFNYTFDTLKEAKDHVKSRYEYMANK